MVGRQSPAQLFFCELMEHSRARSWELALSSPEDLAVTQRPFAGYRAVEFTWYIRGPYPGYQIPAKVAKRWTNDWRELNHGSSQRNGRERPSRCKLVESLRRV